MAMKNLFNSIKVTIPQRNYFDLTHTVLTTFKMGKLTPTLCLENVPSDSFTIGADMLTRFAPLVSPAMHDFHIMAHYFHSPNRIVWDGWEDFITKKNARVFPTVTYDQAMFDTYPLIGYLDLPRPGVGKPGDPGHLPGDPVTVSAFPFAHYQCIYHHWYRPQAVVPDVDFKLVDGDNSANLELFVYRTRAWEQDRLNTALPEPQAGEPVLLPIGDLTDAPVYRNTTPTVNTTTQWTATEQPSGTTGNLVVENLDANTGDGGAVIADDALYADLTSVAVEATTVNDLRTATKIQEWLELAARAGSRYIENILAFFGVKSSDARLQRPEYVVGTKSMIQITEVLNTTGTDERPQGDMAGHGVNTTIGTFDSMFCEEHGYIMCIVSCMPKPMYNGQGVPKHFLRRDVYDFYWPQFAHLGEEAIKIIELYVNATLETRDDTFGYTPRWSDMRHCPNRTAGEFRTTMSYWHEAINFATTPALNEIFVECRPKNEIFAVPGSVENPVDHVWLQQRHNIGAKRPLPVYGTPKFV